MTANEMIKRLADNVELQADKAFQKLHLHKAAIFTCAMQALEAGDISLAAEYLEETARDNEWSSDEESRG